MPASSGYLPSQLRTSGPTPAPARPTSRIAHAPRPTRQAEQQTQGSSSISQQALQRQSLQTNVSSGETAARHARVVPARTSRRPGAEPYLNSEAAAVHQNDRHARGTPACLSGHARKSGAPGRSSRNLPDQTGRPLDDSDEWLMYSRHHPLGSVHDLNQESTNPQRFPFSLRKIMQNFTSKIDVMGPGTK